MHSPACRKCACMPNKLANEVMHAGYCAMIVLGRNMIALRSQKQQFLI